MNNLMLRSLLFLALIIILQSCSPTASLVSYWEAEDLSMSLAKKTLIIGASDKKDVRVKFEDKFHERLQKEKINATQSYVLFPDLKKKKSRTESEKQAILESFKKAGISTVLITSLKETRVIKKTESEAKPIATEKRYGKYMYSFADLYPITSQQHLNDMVKEKYSERDNDNKEPGMELQTTQYLVETLVYDITLEKPKQLVGAYEVLILDPDSPNAALNKLASIVIGQLKK